MLSGTLAVGETASVAVVGVFDMNCISKARPKASFALGGCCTGVPMGTDARAHPPCFGHCLLFGPHLTFCVVGWGSVVLCIFFVFMDVLDSKFLFPLYPVFYSLYLPS